MGICRSLSVFTPLSVFTRTDPTLPLLCPRLLSFSKVFIIMREYVNKIICILSYDKTNKTLYRLSFGTKFFLSLGYLAA